MTSAIREMAQEDPDAVRSVAEKADGALGDRLLEILEEEGA